MRSAKLRSLVSLGFGGLLAAGLAFATVGCGSDTGSNTTTGAGGRGGSGGSAAGNGGSGGSAAGSGGSGGSVTHTVSYTFDSGLQGWMLNTFDEPANLGGMPTGDAGVSDAGSRTPPTVTFEAADGQPSPGSIKLTATYTAYNQYADVLINPSPGLNLAGKTLHANVRLVSVTAATGWTGGVQFHASTGPTYVYANPTGMALTTVGTWVPLSFVLDDFTGVVTGWDPTMVMQIGVQFYSGEAPTTPVTFPVTVVYEIDTVTD